MLHPISKSILLVPLTAAFAATCLAAPKIAVMETAFGDRVKVEHIELAKKAGYSGIQIITGDLDERGLIPLSYPSTLRAFKEASKEHGVEIVGLCAAALNKLPCWEPETRNQSFSVALQSIQACHALKVPILLLPFFGKAAFGNNPDSLEFKAATDLLRELATEAAVYQVTLGIESRTKQPALDYLLKDIGSPFLKVYYDTGNMLLEGEDAYRVIEHWGPETICQMHLKSFDSNEGVFGEGKTDLKQLVRSIQNSGYDGWLVFESGPGKNRTLGFDYAKRNFENIKGMFDDFSN